MKGFTKWLVKHRIAVIILCIALMIPSVLGMALRKVYYKAKDAERIYERKKSESRRGINMTKAELTSLQLTKLPLLVKVSLF